MRRQSVSDQLKQIDAIFTSKTKGEIKITDAKRDMKCNLHGRRRTSSETSGNLNGSIYNISNAWNSSTLKPTMNTNISKDEKLRRRQSFTEGYEQSLRDKNRKKNSWNSNIFGNIEHPSAFPSLLRSTSTQKSLDVLWNEPKNQNYIGRRASLNCLNENRPKQQQHQIHHHQQPSSNLNKRNSFGSSLYLRPDSYGQTNLVRRDSFGSRNLNNLINDIQRRNSTPRDYVNLNQIKSPATPPSTKPTVPVAETRTSILRKNSSASTNGSDEKAKFTKENLSRHVTILENDNHNLRKNNNNYLNKIKRDLYDSNEDFLKARRVSVDSLDLRRSSIDITEKDIGNLDLNDDYKNDNSRPHFVAVTTLEDVQAVRCAEFHPSGRIYAVGSNSKTFRICEYPSLSEVREEHTTYQPTVLFKRTKHHKGSIYCMGWAPDGEVVATGSNDKTIKLMRYDDIKKQLEGREIELTMHDGTIRDLCFLEDSTNKASLLISGGAGDCKIYVTDCGTATPFQALSGHGGHILSLYNWGGAMFVSGSQDKTIRFWDLRTRGCVNTITPATTPGSRQGSPVAAVCVDPSGRLLVSGHEDSSCVLYDIRGNRPIQCFKPHSADIRSIRFSPSAYYLLTAGYDNKLVLTDLQGDLTLPLPSVVVGHHTDKVISGRWHPTDFSFLSTSADKTATLWALPPL